MKERYAFSSRPYWLMVAHIFVIVFCWADVFILSLLMVWQYFGVDSASRDMERIPIVLGVMIALTVITKVVEGNLKSGRIKCGKREFILEDEYFMFIDKNGLEQTVYWQDVARLRLIATKMGFAATVYSSQSQFSLFSYETDPLPISFKEQWRQGIKEINSFRILQKQCREGRLTPEEYRWRRKEQGLKNILSRSEKFFHIIRIFQQKSTNAEIQKDWVVRNLFKDKDIFQDEAN